MDKLAQLDLKAGKLDSLLASATDINSIHIEMKALTRMVKPSVNTFTRVKCASGTPAASLREEKAVFRNHFSLQLGGTSTSFADLADDCLLTLADDPVALPDPTTMTEILPGLNALAFPFRDASGGGATVKTNLEGCAYLFPRLFAYLYFPRVLKIHC